jgi:hypothetical protein
MRLTGVLVLLTTLWLVGPLEAQDALTKRDARGPVTVTVSLSEPPSAGTPIKVKVSLDTHSVGLDGIVFDQVVALRGADGTDLAPAAVEQLPGGGHHRSAVVVFPPQAGAVHILVRNVGGVAARSFVWELPPAR